MIRALLMIVIIACGIVVAAVALFLPELIANRAADPEGLVGTLALGAIALSVAVTLGPRLGDKNGRWFRGAALCLGVIMAGAALVSFASGSWPVAILLSVIAFALLASALRKAAKSRQS